jgi:integrase
LQQADSPTPRRERVAPGIYLQDSNFYAGYNEPGTKRWRLKKLVAKNLRDAKRERGAHLAALREGRATIASAATYDGCLDAYLEALKASGAREKTVRHNRWVADRYLRAGLGPKPVQKIATADVRKVLRDVSHLSGWTQVKITQVMREGFAVAVREDVIVRSPLEKLDPRELPKPGSKKKPRRLDDAELERLLAAAKTKTPGYHALFVLLAFTGLRIREALGLTWRDVDLEQGIVRVERQLGDDDRRHLDVKTENALRELPLYPRLRRALAELKLASPWNHDDDPVFAAGRRKAKGYRNALRALHDAAAEAKIDVAADERLSPHSLRHTYTSHLIVGLELDAATTSKLAGHANPQVTMRVYADDFRKASERNAAVLKRAAERGFGS